MFRVEARTIEEYFAADPAREPSLRGWDSLMAAHAPELARWFYDGINVRTGGMRMQLIGYGSFAYPAPKGASVTWPIVGAALQKNYISVYLSVRTPGGPILDAYRGTLGENRSGRNNFSFAAIDDLDRSAVSGLLRDIATRVRDDPEAVQYH